MSAFDISTGFSILLICSSVKVWFTCQPIGVCHFQALYNVDLEDLKMLKVKLKQEMKNRGLSTRQVAKEISKSHTTVLRALRGEIVDLDTIYKISDWLGVKPATLINSLANTKSALPDQIAVMLGKHPR
jgi:hypothetical protein